MLSVKYIQKIELFIRLIEKNNCKDLQIAS